MTWILSEMEKRGARTLGELAQMLRAEATPEELEAARREADERWETEKWYCDGCGDPLPPDPSWPEEPIICATCTLGIDCCCGCDP